MAKDIHEEDMRLKFRAFVEERYPKIIGANYHLQRARLCGYQGDKQQPKQWLNHYYQGPKPVPKAILDVMNHYLHSTEVVRIYRENPEVTKVKYTKDLIYHKDLQGEKGNE